MLGRLVRRLRLEHSGLGMTRAAVLLRLEREGPQATGQLARAEKVRPQSMSQTLAELEADGLIARRPDDRDLRRTIVELTDEGALAIRQERALREGWLARMIREQLSPSERDLLGDAVAVLARISEL